MQLIVNTIYYNTISQRPTLTPSKIVMDLPCSLFLLTLVPLLVPASNYMEPLLLEDKDILKVPAQSYNLSSIIS